MRGRPSRARPVVPIALALFVGCLAGCSPSRAAETDRIAEILRLREGSVVADVGAGEGEWSVGLALHVGPEGTVLATEVDEELVEEIRGRAESAGLPNVIAILGDEEDTGLAAGCCDAILLRLVYHHFTRPEAMRRSLRRALRPGGRLAVIDLYPQENWRQLPGVPDRGGHGIPPQVLENEMTADGWSVVEGFDDWNGDAERFCRVFEAAGPPTGDRRSGARTGAGGPASR